MALARPFDSDEVDRPVPGHPWRRLAAITLCLTALLTLSWEIYWRAHWYAPGDYKNTAALWTQERRKAVGDATVIVGSSRIFFDIDLDVWERESGVRPIQLALEGTTPVPFLKDLADDEAFAGTVLVGVTAPLFFTGYSYRGDVLEYAGKQSPSEWIGHELSKIIDRHVAFFDDQTRPKTMIFYADMPLRAGMERRMEPHKLEILAKDRNAEMWARVMEDENYRLLAQEVWADGTRRNTPPPKEDGSPPDPFPQESIDEVIGEVKESVDKLRARGGDVVFLRMPYDGGYAMLEDNAFPRERFWDQLVAQTDSVGIAFQDYAQLQGYYLPEWSHIAPRDAETFTAELAKIFYERVPAQTEARDLE